MKHRLWLAGGLLILLSACGGGSDGCSGAFGSLVGGSGLCDKSPNKAPVANAGADQSVTLRTGLIVTLDGSRSIDPDGQTLSYEWSWLNRPANSQANLASALDVKAAFVPDVVGTYVASLVVSDGQARSPISTVSVVVSRNNSAPVASAGFDQNVVVGSTVTLNGSLSSDADSDPLSFTWTLINTPPGSAASNPITGFNSARPTFVADLPGNYVAQLVVNDGRVDSAPKVVTVTASLQNLPPVANAGPDQSVSLRGSTPVEVTLDGTDSFDPNPGDRITFQWTLSSQPTGSTLSLTNPNTSKPRFTPLIAGTYVASLVVTDSGLLSSTHDTVTVLVATNNAPPVAEAGPNQTVVVDKTVQLDGRGSTDADRDPLTYTWRFVSVPPGSQVVNSSFNLGNPDRPTFVPDTVGTYVISLLVNDGRVDSPTTDVTVITVLPNTPPVANAGPPQTVAIGTLVTLDGKLSSDPDGDTLATYTWRATSWPSALAAAPTLADDLTVKATFTPTVAGIYVFELVVNDGKADSLPATVVITVN